MATTIIGDADLTDAVTRRPMRQAAQRGGEEQVDEGWRNNRLGERNTHGSETRSRLPAVNGGRRGFF